jgi:hypothetical protein
MSSEELLVTAPCSLKLPVCGYPIRQLFDEIKRNAVLCIVPTRQGRDLQVWNGGRRMKGKHFVSAGALAGAVLGLCFSGCDLWMQPLFYTDEKIASTVAIRLKPAEVYPNVFYQGDPMPKTPEEWWEATCKFDVIGTRFDTTEWPIGPELYNIAPDGSWDAGDDGSGRILPVKVWYNDSYEGTVSTEFEVMILPGGAGYRAITAYGYNDHNAHGTATPFPSSAGAGYTGRVPVRPVFIYFLVEGSLGLSPPPPRPRCV